MATAKQIRELIAEEIDDSSISTDRIDQLINRCIKNVSKKVLLPSCESVASVNSVVGVNYLTKPAKFGHNLYHASTTDGKITVFTSMDKMLSEYPLFGSQDEVGIIEHCCDWGTKIAIHPVPEAITSVMLFFYELPVDLTENQDIGSYISGEDFQESLCMNYVLWRLWKLLEDGDEGKMVNTNYYRDLYYQAVKEFDVSITAGRSRPKPNRRPVGI